MQIFVIFGKKKAGFQVRFIKSVFGSLMVNNETIFFQNSKLHNGMASSQKMNYEGFFN